MNNLFASESFGMACACIRYTMFTIRFVMFDNGMVRSWLRTTDNKWHTFTRTSLHTEIHAHPPRQRMYSIRNYRLTYPLRSSLNPMKLDSMLCDCIVLGIFCCEQHTSEVYTFFIWLYLNHKPDIIFSDTVTVFVIRIFN